MKRILLITLLSTLTAPAFAQNNGCPANSGGTVRNDQYSHSAKSEQKASQNSMDSQISQFQTKQRYQTEVKAGRKLRKKNKPQY